MSDLEPAPPVSFNLTFMCPDGEVRHPIKSFGEGSQNIVMSSDAEKYSDLLIPGKITKKNKLSNGWGGLQRQIFYFVETHQKFCVENHITKTVDNIQINLLP